MTNLIFLNLESERPKFRGDYRYETAFNAFYKVHHAAAPWPTAKVRCEGEGAELFVPEHLDEADAMPILITSVLNKYAGVYIGVHDLYSERTFVSINGSTIMNSIVDLLWERNEPVHSVGRCVAMRRSGRLFVHPCNVPLPFICRVNVANIMYYKECDTYNPKWNWAFNNTCYMAHLEPQTWHDAFATCLSAGGHLAILQNRNEAEYVKDLFKQITGRRVPDDEFTFLGFSDLFQRYHYRTIHGERIENTGFSEWDDCNNKCGKTNANHDPRCGGFRRSGLLSVADCNVPAMFFCKKSVTSSEYITENPSLRERTDLLRNVTMPEKRSKMLQFEYYDTF
ncbi:uncharacterized protein LOC131844546 [Achroia grisella]|uniref:uncharacterized protein LOC131844546 n=1 Tax=Achroia grisella TaxID=688607 RepID=UPI0027D2AAD9|nr:uncharacterized protein LOC131844546 [Achroia grisella]